MISSNVSPTEANAYDVNPQEHYIGKAKVNH